LVELLELRGGLVSRGRAAERDKLTPAHLLQGSRYRFWLSSGPGPAGELGRLDDDVIVGELEPVVEGDVAQLFLVNGVEVLPAARDTGIGVSKQIRSKRRQPVQSGDRSSLLHHGIELREDHLPVAVLVCLLEALHQEGVERLELRTRPAGRECSDKLDELVLVAVHGPSIAQRRVCHLASDVLEGVLQPLLEADETRTVGVHSLEKLQPGGAAFLDGLVRLFVRGGQP